MKATEQRRRLRILLAEDACIRPASVPDPLSARAAEELGFELIFLAGSDAALAVLGAPDLTLLTMTEFAEQARRIARAVDRPLLVDGDHGYGNALNVRRMVQELEAAGVAGTTIEDTALPAGFGETARLIGIPEALGKLRAAIGARDDPQFVIAGRTNAALCADEADSIARVVAFADAGADAVFVAGLRTRAHLQAVSAAVALPLIIPDPVEALSDAAWLASQRVRICLERRRPSHAAIAAAVERLAAQRGVPVPKESTAELVARLTRKTEFDVLSRDLLGR
jgi:carboxyvinyl-carboxyphosphonate phosphorylmutase